MLFLAAITFLALVGEWVGWIPPANRLDLSPGILQVLHWAVAGIRPAFVIAVVSGIIVFLGGTWITLLLSSSGRLVRLFVDSIFFSPFDCIHRYFLIGVVYAVSIQHTSKDNLSWKYLIVVAICAAIPSIPAVVRVGIHLLDRVREETRYQSAITLGLNPMQLARKRMLPLMGSEIILAATRAITYIIFVEAAMAYLEFSVRLGTLPTWGNTIFFLGKRGETTLALYPAALLILFLVAVRQIGESLARQVDSETPIDRIVDSHERKIA